MNIERRDRIALGFALFVAMGSTAWFGGGAWFTRDLVPVPIAQPPPAEPVEQTQEGAPSAQRRIWERPPRQSSGASWVYEVFTPPEIEHDERRGSFSVRTRAPASVVTAAGEAQTIDFGLKLLTVKHAPFRLQLVGYVGAPDRWQGIFEDQLTGQTMLASAGQRAGDLDYVIESMAVERLPLSSEHAGTARPVAQAVVRDERSGQRVELSDQCPALTDTVVATVSLAGDDDAPRVVRAGDEIVTDDGIFRIGKIQLAPPSLEATKVSARSPSPESCVLLAPTTEFAGLAPPTP